ncbi:MAG: BRCT domain-containing protein [Deltaproteobacteria bacterium]|nr:BRCT domain-containing protein [Deltaproteobacteria bacterium]
MVSKLDEQGQPRSLIFNRTRRRDRSVDELIGVCKGMAADGVVNQAEAEALLKWLSANREVTGQWPANILYGRVCEMLVDGKLDADEQVELLDTLNQLTGPIGNGPSPKNISTSLPLDDPPPDVVFEDRIFCFTGQFVSGTRPECHAMVEQLGGMAVKRPTQKTHYVVIGDLGSRDWAHSSYGRKIETAVKIKGKGFPLALVAEQHWAEYVLDL